MFTSMFRCGWEIPYSPLWSSAKRRMLRWEHFDFVRFSGWMVEYKSIINCNCSDQHFEMFHLQLAWLDGVIKMTDDERTDLKPQEEGEVKGQRYGMLYCHFQGWGGAVQARDPNAQSPARGKCPGDQMIMNFSNSYMMTSLNMVRHDIHDYIWTRANWS